MGIVDKIRSKPREHKIRIIWTVAIAAAVLLIALWALTSRIGKYQQRDTSLFKTIGNGIKDIKNNYRK